MMLYGASSVYATRINQLLGLEQAVERTMPSEVFTGLVVVDVSPLVGSLTQHIRSLVSALLSQLVVRTRASNRAIIEAFQTTERTVLRESTSPKECLQLVQDISAATTLLTEQRGQAMRNKEVDTFLERYRCGARGSGVTRARRRGLE